MNIKKPLFILFGIAFFFGGLEIAGLYVGKTPWMGIFGWIASIAIGIAVVGAIWLFWIRPLIKAITGHGRNA